MLCHHKITTHGANAPWVVLVHGLFGNLDNLNLLAKHLATDFSVLQIDLPDHGLSAHSTHISLDTYQAAVADTCSQVGVTSAFFVGHSLGGKVLMRLAQLQSERVQGLVVADIAPVTYPPRHDSVFTALNGVDLTKVQNRSEVSQWFQHALDDEGTRQFLLKSLRQNKETKVWSWAFNLSTLQRDYEQIISWPGDNDRFNGPTLFIKGGDSDYITSACQPSIVAQFPSAKAHVIQHTGHWLHAQKPAVFNRVVSKFLLAQSQK